MLYFRGLFFSFPGVKFCVVCPGCFAWSLRLVQPPKIKHTKNTYSLKMPAISFSNSSLIVMRFFIVQTADSILSMRLFAAFNSCLLIKFSSLNSAKALNASSDNQGNSLSKSLSSPFITFSLACLLFSSTSSSVNVTSLKFIVSPCFSIAV